MLIFGLLYPLLCSSKQLRVMTPQRWRSLRKTYSYVTKSGSICFLSRDFMNCFHVVRGELRCCTEGMKSTCPGTFDGEHHDGHGRLSTLFLLDQELNLAFRYIVANPPPSTDGATDLLECFLKYGAALVRSVVPQSYNICPVWTAKRGTPIFRDFQLRRFRNVTQFQQMHPRQISRAYLPIPPWVPNTNSEYSDMLRTPHSVWSTTYLAQCSSGAQTSFVGFGHPHYSGRVFRPVEAFVLDRNWKLPELDEEGDCNDGVVPAGYKFMFQYFGDRVGVEGGTSGKLWCFR